MDSAPDGPSLPDDNTTMTEVLDSYGRAGYTGEFSVGSEADVLCLTCRERSAPADLIVTSVRRLEGPSDPADMVAVVALRCPRCGADGVLVVNYGPEASAEQAEVLASLPDHRGSGPLADAQTPDEAMASEQTGGC